MRNNTKFSYLTWKSEFGPMHWKDRSILCCVISTHNIRNFYRLVRFWVVLLVKYISIKTNIENSTEAIYSWQALGISPLLYLISTTKFHAKTLKLVFCTSLCVIFMNEVLNMDYLHGSMHGSNLKVLTPNCLFFLFLSCFAISGFLTIEYMNKTVKDNLKSKHKNHYIITLFL